jgi:hypothetical protein
MSIIRCAILLQLFGFVFIGILAVWLKENQWIEEKFHILNKSLDKFSPQYVKKWFSAGYPHLADNTNLLFLANLFVIFRFISYFLITFGLVSNQLQYTLYGGILFFIQWFTLLLISFRIYKTPRKPTKVFRVIITNIIGAIITPIPDVIRFFHISLIVIYSIFLFTLKFISGNAVLKWASFIIGATLVLIGYILQIIALE